MTGEHELTGIGVELRDARIARGVTIDDAQRATRISRRYLQALEDEDFEALPAPVFARGFLRSYAQYLSIDPTELVSRFPGEPRPEHALPGIVSFDRPQRRTARRGAQRLSDDPPYAEDRLEAIPEIDTTSPSVRLGPWLVAGFVVLAVLAGVVAIVAIGDDEAPVGAPVATTPGVSPGPAQQEAQSQVVSTEPTITLATMPDLLDRTASDATVVLRRSGLPFVFVEIFDPRTPVGAVIDQSPAPGVAIDASTSVTIVISRGPQIAPALPGAADSDATADTASDTAPADTPATPDDDAPPIDADSQ